jgi:hypothetical protein
MRNTGLSEGLLRRLEKLEAASKVERFDSIGIVCIGMGTAEDVEPPARKGMRAGEMDHAPAAEDTPVKEVGNKQFLTLEQILDEEDRLWAQQEMPAVEHEPGADQDMLAMEMENPQPIAVPDIVAEEVLERVHDWYVEADGGVSKIIERITSDPTDWGRNYRRDAMGKLSEDLGLERKATHPGRSAIIWVATKRGTKRFPTKVGTRIIRYG